MRKLMILVSLTTGLFLQAQQKNPAFLPKSKGRAWLTDFTAAKVEAKETKRPILMYFSESEENRGCAEFEKDILKSAEFQDFAKINFVLFKADFPKKKRLKPAEEKQNRELMDKFSVENFPTVVLAEPSGAEISKIQKLDGNINVFESLVMQALEESSYKCVLPGQAKIKKTGPSLYDKGRQKQSSEATGQLKW